MPAGAWRGRVNGVDVIVAPFPGGCSIDVVSDTMTRSQQHRLAEKACRLVQNGQLSKSKSDYWD